MENRDHILKQYRFDHRGSVNPKAVVNGDKFRITMLTECFVRLEYDSEGVFEDRPTQIFWNRYQEAPDFRVEDKGEILKIYTDKIVVTYHKEKPFSRASLMIKSTTTAVHGTGIWRYGIFPGHNLGGTFRTLDGVDGEVGLEGVLDAFESRKIPLAVCIIDMDWHVTDIDDKYGSGWTGYTWNRELFGDPASFIEMMHQRGISTALNLHPALGIRGHETCYKSFAEFMEVDFKREEAIPFDPIDPKFMKGYFEYAHHPHEEEGIDFWWIDWQQGNNTALDGVDPLFLLNHFHFMDHGRSDSGRPFVFSRWSGLGSHKYPIGFSGDTIVTWDSLAFQPEFTSTAANVGYGWWSHDIGGHYNGMEDDELYARWVQFGVFSPIMRLHTSNNYYGKREPWRHGKTCEEIVGHYMRLRHELIPYIYSINRLNSIGEMPLVTPMYYDYPTNSEAYQSKDQYLFGTELMVAPICEPMDRTLKTSKRKFWLPEGQWFDFFDGSCFDGGKYNLCYCGLDRMPVFAKAGAIVPKGVLTAEEGMHGVRLPEKVVIDIFPGANNRFVMYEDDGRTQDYRQGGFVETIVTAEYHRSSYGIALTVDVKVEGDRSLLPDGRTVALAFRGFSDPLEVHVDGGYDISQCLETRTLNIANAHGSLEWKVTLEFFSEYIADDYDPIDAIMSILEGASFPTADKSLIGYRAGRNGEIRMGALGKDMSVIEMIQEINALEVDTKIKEMAIAMLSRKQQSTVR